MKHITIIAGLAAMLLLHACHKKDDTPTLSPFAQSLRAQCTTPFAGRGDSSDIWLPTAFTPNGDGVNDLYWFLTGTNALTSCSISIYDTLGTLVWSGVGTTGIAWDGLDRNTNRISTRYKHYKKATYTTSGGVADSGGTYLFVPLTDAAAPCVRAVPADMSLYRFPDQFLFPGGFDPTISTFETWCN